MRGIGILRFGAVSIFLLLAGCASPPPATTSQNACPAVPPQMCLRPLLSGNWLKWPDHDGAQGEISEITLAPGTLIDRFGSDYGVYFSPKGIPYSQRALPYACDVRAYRVFRVEKAMPVGSATIAPWFDEPGLGTQYKAKQSVVDLLKAGTIVVVPLAPGESPC